MRKTLAVAAIALVSVVLLTRSGVSDALLLFVVLGVIPGTELSLSPLLMLGIIVTIVWLCFVIIADSAYRQRI